MTQYALPTSDIDTTTWAEGAGDADGDAFDELDEGFGAGRGSGSGPDDATTYWESTAEDPPSSTPLETKLSAVTDPAVSTGHVYRSRNRKGASGGRQIDITTRILDGSTSIDNVFNSNVDNVWTTRGTTLGAVDADNIVNYDDLRINTRATETGGGGPRTGQVSAHEFECPDAGPAVGQPTQHRTQGIPTGSGSRDRPGRWN